LTAEYLSSTIITNTINSSAIIILIIRIISHPIACRKELGKSLEKMVLKLARNGGLNEAIHGNVGL